MGHTPTHTHTHTLTSVFFGTIVFGPFLFLLTKEIGKIVELFCFYTVNLTNFAPFVSGNF